MNTIIQRILIVILKVFIAMAREALSHQDANEQKAAIEHAALVALVVAAAKEALDEVPNLPIYVRMFVTDSMLSYVAEYLISVGVDALVNGLKAVDTQKLG